MRACFLLLVACGSTNPSPTTPISSPPPTPTSAPTDEPAPVDAPVVTVPAPPPCEAAVRSLAKDQPISPIDRDAREPISTAEHVAIGRAAKAYELTLYEGKEARLIGESYDRWIAGGAPFEVQQAFTLPSRRVALVAFSLATPASISIDAGPRLIVLTSARASTKWTVALPVSEDPLARVIASIGDDLVLEHGERGRAHREVWRAPARPGGDRSTAACD